MKRRRARRGRVVPAKDSSAAQERGSKLRVINEALVHLHLDGNYATLQRCSREPGGFLDNGIRRRVWPALMGVSVSAALSAGDSDAYPTSHRDENQVQLDVDRSLHHIPDDQDRLKERQALANVVHAVLARNAQLHYYQGFHEVCAVFLQVLGERGAKLVVERVALLHLRDFMMDGLDPVLQQLELMFAILQKEDEPLFRFLRSADMVPYYALSWVLTWCSHNLQVPDSRQHIARLFDFFLCSNPIMPVYLATVITLLRRDEIVGMTPDYAELHHFLQSFPLLNGRELGGLTADELVTATWQLFETYPPGEVQSWRRGSGVSTVKLSPFSCVNRFLQDKSVLDHERKPQRHWDTGDSMRQRQPTDSALVHLRSVLDQATKHRNFEKLATPTRTRRFQHQLAQYPNTWTAVALTSIATTALAWWLILSPYHYQ